MLNNPFLTITSLLASCNLGATQLLSPFSSEHYGNPKVGPWYLGNDLFATLLNGNPNATGYYPISGPDVTRAATSSASVPGWAWDIKVKADIPISYANGTNYPESVQSNVFTGSQITLHSPSNTSMDPSWEVCILRWGLGEQYSNELRQDDGSCSSVLDDACRNDIQKTVAKSWAAASDSNRCLCPDLSSISSCGSAPATFKELCNPSCELCSGPQPIMDNVNHTYCLDWNATDVNNGTSNTPSSWSDGQLLAQTYGGEAASPGNTTNYDQTGTLAWPFMVVWAPTALGAEPKTQLTCIRASNATTGSRVPGQAPGKSSGTLNDQKYLTLVLASMVAAFWMTRP